MQQSAGVWSLLLAGGEGRRLRALTADAHGRVVPKQYCSMHGGPTLLQCAMERALAASPADRISIIVAAEHRRWWYPLQETTQAQFVVQPRNRGTGNGILLQLLHVAEADPNAEVLLLPCDHFVSEEQVLGAQIQRAVARVRALPRQIVLLGVEPEFPDPELGYIVPGPVDGEGFGAVAGFVEKPPAAVAARLIGRGALLNTFILAARCTALLELFARAQPAILESMRRAMNWHNDRRARLAALYEQLPVVDFSAEVLARVRGPALSVLAVPECGWSDLGTPERVGRTLLQFEGAGWRAPPAAAGRARAVVDLAENYWHAMAPPVPPLRATA
jgi:mannose-1-phosphate guanylyltransferase